MKRQILFVNKCCGKTSLKRNFTCADYKTKIETKTHMYIATISEAPWEREQFSIENSHGLFAKHDTFKNPIKKTRSEKETSIMFFNVLKINVYWTLLAFWTLGPDC